MAAVVRRLYAALEARDWTGVAEVLAADVTYEMPQSRERIRGQQDYLRFNRDYPGDWHLALVRTVTEGDQVVAWVEVSVDGVAGVNLAWITLDDAGLIREITDFWPEPSVPRPDRPPYVQRY